MLLLSREKLSEPHRQRRHEAEYTHIAWRLQDSAHLCHVPERGAPAAGSSRDAVRKKRRCHRHRSTVAALAAAEATSRGNGQGLCIHFPARPWRCRNDAEREGRQKWEAWIYGRAYDVIANGTRRCSKMHAQLSREPKNASVQAALAYYGNGIARNARDGCASF